MRRICTPGISLTVVSLFLLQFTYSQDMVYENDMNSAHNTKDPGIAALKRHMISAIFTLDNSNTYQDPENGKHVSLPGIGLGYEFWLDEGLGFGADGIFMLSDYNIIVGDTLSKERKNPVKAFARILINPGWNIQLSVGPGIETGKGDNFLLFDFTAGYRITFWNQWNITPRFFYELKDSSINAYGITISAGISLK